MKVIDGKQAALAKPSRRSGKVVLGPARSSGRGAGSVRAIQRNIIRALVGR